MSNGKDRIINRIFLYFIPIKMTNNNAPVYSRKLSINGQRLISLIESDMANGQVVSARLIRYAENYIHDRGIAEDIFSGFIYTLIRGKANQLEYVIRDEEELKNSSKVQGFLFASMRYLCINYLRRIKTLKALINNARGLNFDAYKTGFERKPAGQTPDESAMQTEKEQVIGEVMDSVTLMLSKPIRETLLLYLSGYKYKEISERLGIPIGTVKSRMHSAKQHIKSKLSDSEQRKLEEIL